jgi:hypothetical protein
MHDIGSRPQRQRWPNALHTMPSTASGVGVVSDDRVLAAISSAAFAGSAPDGYAMSPRSSR